MRNFRISMSFRHAMRSNGVLSFHEVNGGRFGPFGTQSLLSHFLKVPRLSGLTLGCLACVYTEEPAGGLMPAIAEKIWSLCLDLGDAQYVCGTLWNIVKPGQYFAGKKGQGSKSRHLFFLRAGDINFARPRESDCGGFSLEWIQARSSQLRSSHCGTSCSFAIFAGSWKTGTKGY